MFDTQATINHFVLFAYFGLAAKNTFQQWRVFGVIRLKGRQQYTC